MRISDWSSDVCSSDLCYAPEMEKRLRWFWRRGFDPSWRLDETYVKVRGKWTYLYRAVDKRGDTIDFYRLCCKDWRQRSKERRVGKECVSQGRSRWSPYH